MESAQWREEFPIFKAHPALVYLDSAATTHKPKKVIETLQEFYSTHYGTVHRAVYSLAQQSTESYHAVRRKVARFIHAEHVEEIIFTRGTTASLNLVARSFGKAFLNAGDTVLISEIEHHSNIVPWQMICAEQKAHLKIIPVNERGELDLSAFAKLLEERVKIISIAHISNVLGTLHPLEKIITMAHAKGAYVCVDGAQSIAHLSVDVQALDIDFFAFSSHKMYGPTGVGVLYGKKALLEKMPPVEGGGDMIESVSFDETTFLGLPQKFEAGTPMIAEVIGLGAAVDFLNARGIDKIGAWEQELIAQAREELSKIPHVRLIGEAAQKGSIISFDVEGVHPLDLATFLDCKGIAIRSGHQCSQPTMKRFGITSLCRLSVGMYNTPQDLFFFINSLKETLNLLQCK